MTIPEFTAKKLGEVLAFCRVGDLMVRKGGSAIAQALGQGAEIKISEELKGHASRLEELALISEIQDTAFSKAEKTGAKLTSMMEMYIGDEWNNPSELMEWMGFFEGSAIVHWQLVAGSTEALGYQELAELSERAIKFHAETLTHVSETLKKIGRDKTLNQ